MGFGRDDVFYEDEHVSFLMRSMLNTDEFVEKHVPDMNAYTKVEPLVSSDVAPGFLFCFPDIFCMYGTTPCEVHQAHGHGINGMVLIGSI